MMMIPFSRLNRVIGSDIKTIQHQRQQQQQHIQWGDHKQEEDELAVMDIFLTLLLPCLGE